MIVTITVDVDSDREYFKDRPGDLLVMDMDSNPGWNALCAFLERPIPAEPYPMKLVTRKTV